MSKQKMMVIILTSVALLACGQIALANHPLEASGVIQTEEIRIASEFQGAVSQMLVQSGDRVTAGQVLLILDSSSV